MKRSSSLHSIDTLVERKISNAKYQDVITVADNIADVVTVANDLNEPISEIEVVASNIADVNTVGTNIANVNTTAANIADVNSVATDIANVNTTATNIADVNVTAANIANVNTVAADLNEPVSEIDTVANSITNVDIVGTAITNVNTVATDIANVNTVATDIANVNTTATNIADVNTTATDIANVNVVATDITNVNTTATNIADVNIVSTNIADVNTVASGIVDINNYADTYYHSLAVAPTIISHPTLSEGDLYFDTGLVQLRVYDGTVWTAAGSTVNGIDKSEQFVVGTPSGIYDGVSTTVFPLVNGYDAGYAVVYWNGIALADADVDITSGTSVSITSTEVPIAGDIIKVVAFGAFVLADHYTKAAQDVIDAAQDAAIALKAPLASPVLTGTPTVPTASSGTSTTQIASTEFVAQETALMVVSDTTGVTGADQIANIISLTQAEYDAIVTPDAATFYVIVG